MLTGAASLAKYLAKKKWNPADFARLTGISEALLSRYLSGQRSPGLENALLIETSTGGLVRATSWLNVAGTGPRTVKSRTGNGRGH